MPLFLANIIIFVLRYLEKQFPLAAIGKLAEAKYAEMRNVAAFKIFLEVFGEPQINKKET